MKASTNLSDDIIAISAYVGFWATGTIDHRRGRCAKNRECDAQASLTSCLPMFCPLSSAISPCGARSRPSITDSRALSRPSA